MRAILLTAFGSSEHFRLAELPLPEPQAGEVRIRIHATAFNPTDYQKRQGTEVGELSVETARRAHAQLETGHVQGKLVMLVG